MRRVEIEDGNIWPDPSDEGFIDTERRMRHGQDCVTAADMLNAASVMDAYSALIEHPVYSRRVGWKKIKRIRKAVANRRAERVYSYK